MKVKTISMLVIAIMVMAAVGPLATAVVSETDASSDDTVNGLSMTEDQIFSIVTQIVQELPEDFTEEELIDKVTTYGEEMGIPEYGLDPLTWSIIILVLWGATFGVGYWQGYEAGSNDHATAGGVVEYEQTMLAKKMKDHLDTVVNICTQLFPNDANMLRFTATYWERAIEFVISSPDVWSKTATMDVEDIIKRSGLRESLCNYIHTWQWAIANELISVSSEQVLSIASDDMYSGMKVSFDWGTSSLVQSDPSSSKWAYCDIKPAVLTTNATSTIYLDIPEEHPDNVQFSNILYLYSPEGLDAKMIPVKTADDYRTHITLHPGVNSVAGLTPGLYILATQGVIYAGDFAYSSSNNAAGLKSCMIMSDGDGKFAYALYNSDNEFADVYTEGRHYNATKLDFEIGFKSRQSNNDMLSTSLLGLLKGFQGLLDSAQYLVEQCKTDATVTWNIFDAAEQSSAFVHPSSIIPVLEDSNLNADNLFINYYAAMKQLSLYYQQYGDSIGNFQVTADPDMTDVLVLGDVYCNGNLIVKGVIFTPVVFYSSETLKINESHSCKQAMICTVWVNGGATSMSDYATHQSTASKIPIMTLDSGCTIEVKQIQYRGTLVQSHTLKVPEIVYSPNAPHIPEGVPESIKVLNIDTDTLMMIIMLELAALAFLICLYFQNPVAGVVIALIIAAIGIFFSGGLSDIYLGTFKWPWETWKFW